ncbi:MAG: 4'-phosphopantetheinyl transferase superfamily protein [Streptosporangiaceae bacterium]
MIENILPAQVAVTEAFGDPREARLFPVEAELVRRSVEKRRREFTTVRWCARQALGRLEVPPAPILPGAKGAPQWPAGVVGSMTHCDGYRAAAVALGSDAVAIGIDAEPCLPLPAGVGDAVSLAAERDRERGLRRSAPDVPWDRLLFSAKESVYKAWFPLTRRWLDFEEADVVLGRDGTFTATLSAALPAQVPGVFAGKWLMADGLLVTAIALLRA